MIELIIVLVITGLGWMIYQAYKAPEGHEDKDGFHIGKEQK